MEFFLLFFTLNIESLIGIAVVLLATLLTFVLLVTRTSVNRTWRLSLIVISLGVIAGALYQMGAENGISYYATFFMSETPSIIGLAVMLASLFSMSLTLAPGSRVSIKWRLSIIVLAFLVLLGAINYLVAGFSIYKLSHPEQKLMPSLEGAKK